MAWTFEFLDEKFDMATLTLDDYVQLEDKAGVRWGLINPALSARCAQIILAYMYAKRTDSNYDDALAKAKTLNADEFANVLNFQLPSDGEESEPDPPLPAGES